MKNLLRIVSILGLGFTFVPSLMVFSGAIEKQTHFILMAIGMIMWFGTAPFWMKSKSLGDAD